ncbi:hypothetical protein BT93_E2124 [Corymbia citriodora subsp. variegata]|nr:hypothetical protein BT93_E2124 [Corymbia citriodora subsp. variegata]
MAFSLKSEFIISLVLVLNTWAWHAMSVRTLHESNIAEQHEQWMAQYGRTYKHPEEKEKRRAIFKKNLLFIEEFNASGNRTFKLGVNQFSDLTDDEFVRRPTGYLASKQLKSPRNASLSQRYPTGDVPESIDWVEKGAVNPIKDQGQCSENLNVLILLGILSSRSSRRNHAYQKGKLPVLSEQQLIDCDTENDGCEGGLTNKAFQYIIQNEGIASEDSYPYQEMDGTCDSTEAAQQATKIKSFADLQPGEDELLKAVAQQPVSIGIAASGQEFSSYSGGVFNGDCGEELDHAVVVVGYGTSEDGKFWKIRNSWGETWGENGYMRIQRGGESSRGLCGLASQASYPIA